MKKKNIDLDWKGFDDVIFTPKQQGHTFRNLLFFLVVIGLIYILFFTRFIKNLLPFPETALTYTIDQFECNHPTLTRESISNINWSERFQYLSVPFHMQGKITNSSMLDVANVKIYIRFFGIKDNSQTWGEYVTIPYVPANSSKEFSYVLKQYCTQGDIQWEFSISSFEKV